MENNAFDALSNGDLQVLKNLLEQGLDPNARDKSGKTLIHIAIEKLNSQGVELLLQSGANPNQPDEVPHFVAFASRELERVLPTKTDPILPFRHLPFPGMTPLMKIAYHQKGPGFAQHEAARLSTPQDPTKGWHDYPLPPLRALEERRLAIAKALIQHGANVGVGLPKSGLTPLHFAVNSSSVELTKFLLSERAPVNKEAFGDVGLALAPLSLAYNPSNGLESAEITRLLLLAKADYKKEVWRDFEEWFKSLTNCGRYFQTAAQYFIQQTLTESSVQLSRERVSKVVEEYLRENPSGGNAALPYVGRIVSSPFFRSSFQDELTHFTHLRSWVGDIPITKPMGLFDRAHLPNTLPSWLDHRRVIGAVHAEGWLHGLAPLHTLKNLLQVIRHIDNSRVDCQEAFGESRPRVMHKLKEELFHLATSCLTATRAVLLRRFEESSVSRQGIPQKYSASEAFHWCNHIRNLQPGQRFCIGGGNAGHSLYIDFMRQADGNLTKTIYNLGQGNEPHPLSMEHRIYPYVVENIPFSKFQLHHPNAIEDLKKIILEFSSRDATSIHKNLYAHTLQKVGGNTPKDYSAYWPMKLQIAGNCTVKNLHFSMLNRLNNKKLYKFIKIFEKNLIQDKLQLPENVIRRKELEKDLVTLQAAIIKLGAYPEILEKEFFHFFEKRSTLLPQPIYEKPGDRIVHAISHLKNPEDMHRYFQTLPWLFKGFEQIASITGSRALAELSKSYFKETFIHPAKEAPAGKDSREKAYER